uniref:Uncharacterized protein n=1 Tax=Rhizophora mucronata TaxID=61149 RepID=A0A2P2Q8G8_RHIMU
MANLFLKILTRFLKIMLYHLVTYANLHCVFLLLWHVLCQSAFKVV